MLEQSLNTEAFDRGWMVEIVDDANPQPIIPEGWKAFKWDISAPVESIPQADPKEKPRPAVARRIAYMMYAPVAWVWAGESGGELIYQCQGRKFYLSPRF